MLLVIVINKTRVLYTLAPDKQRFSYQLKYNIKTTRYTVQPRGKIFVKGYRFLSFNRNICKTISTNLGSKYSQKLFDHVKQFATDALKTVSK